VALREKSVDSGGTLVVVVNGKEHQRINYKFGGMDLVAPVRLRDAVFKPGANVVEVKREGAGTGWFAATWDVYNQDENLVAVANEVTIKRKYTLLGKVGGPRATAEAEYGMLLESGDRIQVELEITAKKPAQYVMVEDLKAAGLEAILQRSGPEVCRYQCTHAELRPDRVAMFFSYLNMGTTRVSYELRAEVPGKFHARPARLEAMYAPELRATSDEMRLEVRDARGPMEGVAVQ
jgi:alpha-2-macroglobulin